MPDAPASIISLNFDPKGLSETQKGAKDLEGIFGRIGGIAEGLGKSLAGLAGVAGLGAIVHDFMRIETAATRTALAVNNIRGGSGMMNSLLGAQSATGVDAVDLAGGVRASQQFAGGRFLGNTRNAGNYATFLGHGSMATGLDATTLGMLLGQGLSVQGQSFSQQGAQSLLTQAYTASARAGQGGMTGDFLQALTGLVNTTGFFGRGRNRAGMAGAMGAAMAGDSAFANPQQAAGAIGSVESVIQGSLSNPRLMAALQMSGANINDVLSGDFSAAQKLAKFAKSQGSMPSKLFFYNTFGQQGGRLMEDLANGKVNPQEFQRRMKQDKPQDMMRQLLDRASSQEHTAAAELMKLRGEVTKDLAGPLKHIESMLAGILGNGTLIKGALGLVGARAGAGLLGRLGAGKLLGRVGGRALGAGSVEALEALGLPAGALAGLTGLGVVGAGVGGFALGEHLLDKTHRYKHTGPLGLLRRPKTDEELDLDHLPDNMKHIAGALRGKSRNKQEDLLKRLIKDYAGTGTETDYRIQQALVQMLQHLKSLDDKTGKGGSLQGASFMPGGPGGGGASGLQMAAWVALGGGGGGGGSGTSFASSFFPGGSSSGGGGGGGGGNPSGGGWKDCVLTWYDPALGGINSGDGSKDPHHKTASGEPYDPNAYTCAAPSAYAFGTQIEFAYGGKTITCRVNDRGGAIQGSHFDLSRAAGKALGIGNTKAKFRVKSGGGGGGGKGGGGGGTQHIPKSVIDPSAKAAPASVGGGFGGMALGGGFPSGGGSGGNVNVYLDNRLIEKARHRTRAM